MHLAGVPAAQLGETWPQVRDLVAGACLRSEGKYRAEDILKALLARDMQLWTAADDSAIAAIGITEIVNYPGIKVVRLLCTTGEGRADWQDLMAGLETWGLAQGCACLEVICRPGWERALRHQRFKKTHVILSKELRP